MFEKIKFSFFNIFLLCVCFGLLFFVKVESYAVPYNASVISLGYPNDTLKDIYSLSYSLPEEARYCFYVHSISGWTNHYGEASRADLCSNLFERVDISWSQDHYVNTGNVESPSWSHQERTSGSLTEALKIPSSSNSAYYPNYLEHDIYVSDGWGNEYVSSSGLPVFTNVEDVYYYLDHGTLPEKPFDETIKLDKFKVYMKGVFSLEFVKTTFNQVVVCPIWSNPDISEVVISIYAVDPAYRYNTVNYSYARDGSGQYQTLDISGLTLHDQKFVIRATPYTDSARGVAIQYEFTFPKDFDQPIGQLVIPNSNTYPYSTTLDISGNDVPIEWTVTQTPIYVYETNNIENYYYGDPVSYPVPVITQDTPDNYYTEYISNYYDSYETVINNYNTSFDFDFGDISGNDIQQGYDDVGNFFNGVGGLVSKVAQLFAGLFPFLSPAISVTIVAAFGLLIVIGGIVLFVKIIKALLP